MREEHRIKSLEIEEYPEVPKEAVREAVVNAVAHRDYTVREPIRVFMFIVRIESHSPSKLSSFVTIESIGIGGAHGLRNTTKNEMLNLLKIFKGLLLNKFEKLEILLFGSQVKSSAEKEFGIDVFIILSKKDDAKIIDEYKLNLEYTIVLDVNVYSKFEYNRYRGVLSLIMNIERREGVYV